MMEVRLRTTRTLKVTEPKVSDEELQALADLYQDSRYEALLNVMERACIETETAHFNTAASDPEAVLGGHLVCKASWKFFIYVQKAIRSAWIARQSDDKQVPQGTSLNDMLQGVEGVPDDLAQRWD